MGLLDDAIKEHLELKRRRGADPTEIEREEREALGPVRRMAEENSADDDPISAEVPEAQHVAEPEFFDDEHEDDHEHEEFEDDDDDIEEDTAAHTVVDHAEPAQPSDSAAEPAGPADARYDESVSPAYDDEDEDGPETAEYDVEAEHHHGSEPEHPRSEAEGPEGEDDDMLEETPEFLQDAPEHDRLWFEQRPPKDFDFDG
jgi:hypothetical protein